MAKNITTREQDYNQWYLDVIKAAQLADYSPVRGCMVIRPTGYALWEAIQGDLDARFKATGHTNAYFPLLIPVSFLQKEADHVDGFAMECAVVTHSGLEASEDGLKVKGELAEPLVVRPTSETVIGHMYSQWIQSYRDLPVLLNQWANVMRWELRTRLFLRTAEFLWQEGHTAHETAEEAQEETLKMLDVYAECVEEFLAVPVIKGQKTESEKFPGADTTYCIEALMQDGKALQAGTSHNLGQNFAKAFDIGFLGRDNQRHLCWTTSWGVSTRLIGALIMTHSDDEGLVLPPRMAPVVCAIVPIYRKEGEKEQVMEACRNMLVSLCGIKAVEQAESRLGNRDQLAVFFGEGHRQQVILDMRDTKPVEKHFYWEQRGVPFRLEVGPRDVAKNACVLKNRLSRDKEFLQQDELSGSWLENKIEAMQSELFQRAQTRTEEGTCFVDSYEELKKALAERSGFVRCWFNPDVDNEQKIKEETKGTVRCIPLDQPGGEGTCIYSGEPAKQQVIFAIAY
ncbi:MAG TPA: proline--tRNA ligase [Phycisphaerales bacterium]|nr:proline--tRNA ligase [Phycisphaerales bacterium]